MRWLNTPPTTQQAARSAPTPRARPAVLPAGAPVTAAEQAAAFTAFQASSGL